MNEENVRKELHDCIDKYGIQDIKTLKKSQELDKIISNIMAAKYVQASVKK